MHQTRPYGTAGVPDAEHPGQLPGVVVTAPDVDLATGEALGHLLRAAAVDVEVGGRGAAGGAAVGSDMSHAVQSCQQHLEKLLLMLVNSSHRGEHPVTEAGRLGIGPTSQLSV